MIAFVSKLNIDIYFFILVETPRTMPSPQIQLICGGRPCPRCQKCSDWDYDQSNGTWNRRDGYTCRGGALPGYPHFIGDLCDCNR